MGALSQEVRTQRPSFIGFLGGVFPVPRLLIKPLRANPRSGAIEAAIDGCEAQSPERLAGPPVPMAAQGDAVIGDLGATVPVRRLGLFQLGLTPDRTATQTQTLEFSLAKRAGDPK